MFMSNCSVRTDITGVGKVSKIKSVDLDPLLAEQDQPVFAPGMTGNRALYRAAWAAGCRAILDGHGGDEVIGGAFADIGWLIEELRISLFAQSIGTARSVSAKRVRSAIAAVPV